MSLPNLSDSIVESVIIVYYDEDNDEPLTTPDTTNSTKFHHQEGGTRTNEQDQVGAATGIPFWKRMSGINSGAVDSFGNRNESRARYQERVAAWDTMSEHLRLSQFQKRHGRDLMGEFDTENFGRSLFLAAFCLAAYVVRKDPHLLVDNDAPNGRVYHPQRNDENNCPIFLAVCEDFGFDGIDNLHGCLNRVPGCLP